MHCLHFFIAAMFCTSSTFGEGTTNGNADVASLSQMNTDEGSVQMPFGTYPLPDLNAPQMEALVGGTLVLEGNCLYLGNDNSRFIPIFPAEHTLWIDARKEVSILGTTISVGQHFETNGGYVTRGTEIFGGLNTPIPSTCKGSEVVVVGTQAWTADQ